MDVLIVGATGQLGHCVTQAALDAGHRVTGLTRSADRLTIEHPSLTVQVGDPCNPADVDAAVAGCDAVIITIGSGRSRKNTVRSDSTRHVIDAMHRHGVKRLICETTLGCQETWEQLNFYWKRIMFGALLRPIFLDHEKQERLTEASELDWTIVRPSAFTDVADESELRVDFPPSERGLKFTVAKHEVASVIVDQLDDRTFVNRAISVSH